MKEKKLSLAGVSEKMGMAESTLRSWTNGTREINLSDFFKLCAAAQLNPAQVLFGSVPLDPETRRSLGELVTGVLDADPAILSDYQKMTKKLRQTVKG